MGGKEERHEEETETKKKQTGRKEKQARKEKKRGKKRKTERIEEYGEEKIAKNKQTNKTQHKQEASTTHKKVQRIAVNSATVPDCSGSVQQHLCALSVSHIDRALRRRPAALVHRVDAGARKTSDR